MGAGASLGAELAGCGAGTGSGVGWTGAVSGGGAGSGVGADTLWAAAVGVAHAAAERKAITSSFKVSPGGLGLCHLGQCPTYAAFGRKSIAQFTYERGGAGLNEAASRPASGPAATSFAQLSSSWTCSGADGQP